MQPTMNSCWATSLFIVYSFLRKNNVSLHIDKDNNWASLVEDMRKVLGSFAITNKLKTQPMTITHYNGPVQVNSYLSLFEYDLGSHFNLEQGKGITQWDLYHRQGPTGKSDVVGRLPHAYSVDFFRNSCGLTMEGFTDENLTIESIMKRLKEHGPLIVCYDADDIASDEYYSGHCVVVVGADTNMTTPKGGVEIFDPFPKFDEKGAIIPLEDKIKTESIALQTFQERCKQHRDHIGANFPIGWIYDGKVYK